MIIKYLINNKPIDNIDDNTIISFEDEIDVPSIGEHVILPTENGKQQFLVNAITKDLTTPKSCRTIYVYVNNVSEIKE